MENLPNRLPEEILLKIFNYLDYMTLFSVCRLVCKQWRCLVGEMRFKELAIVGSTVDYDKCWFNDYKPLNMMNTVSFYCCGLSLFDFLCPPFDNNFYDLRFLAIHDSSLQIDCFLLNQLVRLEHLELNYLYIQEEEDSLLLLNLRVLLINERRSRDDLVLNCDAAKLKILKCNNLGIICLRRPSTVEHVHTSKYHTVLKRFTNLKVLKLNELSDEDNLLLLILPHLKRLHYFVPLLGNFSKIMQFESLFIDLKDQNEHLQILDFRLYINGVRLIKRSQFNDLTTQRNYYQLFHKHYRLLASTLPEIEAINYNLLMSTFSQPLLASFLKKLVKIRRVHVHKKVDQDQFLSFLKLNCPSLSDLSLHYPSFNQTFYDQLPNATNRLISKFCLIEKLPVDFNFLSHFRLLHRFRTNQLLSTDLVVSELIRFKLIHRFIYRNAKNLTIVIESMGRSSFSVRFAAGDVAIQRARKQNLVIYKEDLTLDRVEEIRGSLESLCSF